MSSVNNNNTSAQKSPLKAPTVNIAADALKAQPANVENNNKNITHANDDKKKPEVVNDGSNDDDDDDSVFLKTVTSAKHKNDASSVKSSNAKTLNVGNQVSATQNPISLDSNVQSETVAR